MSIGVYLNFRTESKAAISFYEHVFNTKSKGVMTFADMPQEKGYIKSDLILNASITIHGMNMMISDVPENMPLTMGNNITLVISTDNETQLETEFNEMAKTGKVILPLSKTFFSEKYGYVIDQFGIGWQFNLQK